MKSGFAKIEITPPLGTAFTGYAARQGVIEQINDPLFARAIVFDDGRHAAALITCDLLGLTSEFVQLCRAQISEQTGIPASHIMISCTHTHSGPATLPIIGCGDVDADYLNQLRVKIVQAAEFAFGARQKSGIGFGKSCLRIGINRRVAGADPNAPMDDELIVIKIADESGNALGLLSNYGCHGTSIDPQLLAVSGDYAGLGMTRVEELTGPSIVSAFTNGGGADVNPEPRGAYQNAVSHGRALATGILSLLPTIECADISSIQVNNQTVVLPFHRLPTMTELETESNRIQRDLQSNCSDEKTSHDMLDWIRLMKDRLQANGISETLTVSLQAIISGEIALIALPFEVFSSTVKWIKRASPFPCTLVISQGNGDFGYLPPGDEFRAGGYEIDLAHKYYGHPSAFSHSAEELDSAFGDGDDQWNTAGLLKARLK